MARLQTNEQHQEYKRRVKKQADAHEPTQDKRNQVAALMFADTEPPIIAQILGIPLSVLNRCYRNEIKLGKALVAARLKLSLVDRAIKGDKGVLGALARAMGLGRDDKPMEPRPTRVPPPGSTEASRPAFDVSNLSDEGLAQILADIEQGSDPPDRPRRARAA